MKIKHIKTFQKGSVIYIDNIDYIVEKPYTLTEYENEYDDGTSIEISFSVVGLKLKFMTNDKVNQYLIHEGFVIPSNTPVDLSMPTIYDFVRNVFNKLENTGFKLQIDEATDQKSMMLMFETLNIDFQEGVLHKDGRNVDVNLTMFDCDGLDFNEPDFNDFVKAGLNNDLSVNISHLKYMDIGLVEEIVIYTGDDPKDAEQSIYIERLCK